MFKVSLIYLVFSAYSVFFLFPFYSPSCLPLKCCCLFYKFHLRIISLPSFKLCFKWTNLEFLSLFLRTIAKPLFHFITRFHFRFNPHFRLLLPILLLFFYFNSYLDHFQKFNHFLIHYFKFNLNFVTFILILIFSWNTQFQPNFFLDLIFILSLLKLTIFKYLHHLGRYLGFFIFFSSGIAGLTKFL